MNRILFMTFAGMLCSGPILAMDTDRDEVKEVFVAKAQGEETNVDSMEAEHQHPITDASQNEPQQPYEREEYFADWRLITILGLGFAALITVFLLNFLL